MTLIELVLFNLALAYQALAQSLAGTPYGDFYLASRDCIFALLRTYGWNV